ncbi:response regulator [Cohnella sp. CFH 77786]|uniref:response regulator transcription factor n=1 Tax=Cohnella sp. CFH 77786 TaxID=2662265 RepID=UPI001C60D56C|nr:response regulator [Cohnella sp. CFH 77786]MBW5448243.1 response regulator [Cohnella sp. CFH 77786]
MLKVMVVDDEENIRLGIVEGIDWGSYGLEVACQAENGRVALELAERHRPDIILLDINMPFVNGLEFSKQARQFLPDSFIIILSGYSDFEYAKESIKYGVSEYLLKPVSPGELMEAILKARDMLTENIRKEQYLNGLKQQFLQSIPALREKWVYDLLHSSYLENESVMKDKLGWLGIDFPSDKFAVCVIRIEDLAERSSGREEDKQLFLYAVKNICDEILSRNAWGLSVVTNEGLLEGLLSLDGEDGESYRRELQLKAEGMEKSIREFLGLTVTVRFGSVYSGYSQIAYSYREAYSSVQLKRPGKEHEESAKGVGRSASVLALVFPYDKEQEMIRYLKAMNEKAVNAAADLLDEIEANELIAGDPEHLAAAAIQIVGTVRKLLTDSGIPVEEEEGLHEPPGAAGGFKAEDPAEIRAKLLRHVSSALHGIIKAKGKPYRIEIEQVKRYIEENYDKDISLKDLSSRVYMNPNYLCTIFKNEVGETINHYMTRVRMEKAMRMLRETDLKVFEIAERVGYSNTNYFSYTFKKYTGTAPIEYR